MATRGLLASLIDSYASESGVRVVFESVGGVQAAKRIRAGEAFDLVVLASDVIVALEREGFLRAGYRIDLARSSMAMAIPAGDPAPDITSVAGLQAAMLNASRIGYSTGPSGDQLKRLLQRWGMESAVAGRLVQAPPGVPVGVMVARSEADIGFQQLSEFLGVDGIDIVGRLPPELETDTVFSAGLPASCSNEGAARTFLAFLASSDTAEIKRGHGMEPA